MRRLAAVLLTGVVLVSGCSTEENPSDPLQLAATLEPATPASSPAPSTAPTGSVVPSGAVDDVAVVGDRLAVALADPPSVALYALAEMGAPKSVPLPGRVARLVAVDDAVEAAVPSAGVVVTVKTDGSSSSRAVDGGPVDLATVNGKTLVAQRDARQVRSGDREIGGISSPDRVLAVGRAAVVLDRPRSAVFDLDPDGEGPGAGLRAGEGATNAVVDRFDRVWVVDTRGGELLAFSAKPLIMRLRYPLPGAPYGLAYDAGRDLLWTTLTERNEVVAYDVSGGEPVEKRRVPTVRQPNSVAADAQGRVYVGSGSGEGVQVITS
ncbi:hypothetical protein [Actinosynnema sp. NPDC020468]|uniref:YncE family protein n=1 Tax=Actinosynnema sp. NPDC020468 TaxID=3154488 RepID=UPI0033E264C9